MNRLEQEAENLKCRYGRRYYKHIEYNLKSVSEQMKAAPGSIAVQEGLIALSYGLPPLRGRTQKSNAHKPDSPKKHRK